MTNKTVKAGLDAKAPEAAKRAADDAYMTTDENAVPAAVCAGITAYLSALPHAGVSEEPADEECELSAEDLARIDQAWETHKAAIPVARVINDNQPGKTAIIEILAEPPTLEVGTELYASPKIISTHVGLVGYVTKDTVARLSEGRVGGSVYPAGILHQENEVALSSQHAEAVPVAWQVTLLMGREDADGGDYEQTTITTNPNFVKTLDPVRNKVVPLYASPVPADAGEPGIKADSELDQLRTYAREATIAITGLTAGGSEYFGKMIGDLYTADLPFCVERIRAAHQRTQDWLTKALDEKRCAEGKIAASVTVKQLEWDACDRADIYAIKPTYGSCGAKAFMLVRASVIFDTFFDTIDEAKVFAQADYEARLRSALVPTSQAPKVCEACNGRGTEADWVGLEMQCVEVACSACAGMGTTTSPAKGGVVNEDLIKCAEILAGLEENRSRSFPTEQDCEFARATLAALRTSVPVGQTAKEE